MKEKIIVPGKEDKVAKDIGPAMFEFIAQGYKDQAAQDEGGATAIVRRTFGAGCDDDPNEKVILLHQLGYALYFAPLSKMFDRIQSEDPSLTEEEIDCFTFDRMVEIIIACSKYTSNALTEKALRAAIAMREAIPDTHKNKYTAMLDNLANKLRALDALKKLMEMLGSGDEEDNEPTEPESCDCCGQKGVERGEDKPNPYTRSVHDYDTIDVYDVLNLYGVHDPDVAHAVKKLLCAGKRGSKDYLTDLQEAQSSLARAIQDADKK